MHEPRLLNGYRVVYHPEHHAAMHSRGSNGFVYEHIYEAERMLGRELAKDEVVHHLDFNRTNNCWRNLLVLSRSMHSKLHKWLNSSDLVSKDANENGKNSMKSHNSVCKHCGLTLPDRNMVYCSKKCADAHRCVNIPSRDTLVLLLSSMSMSAVGRKYHVSCNAVRRWVKRHGIIPSRASGTPLEGVETSGAV